MKFSNICSGFIKALTLASFIIVASCSKDVVPPVDPNPDPPVNNDPSKIFNPATDNIVVNHELRAAWLTTAWGLDWPAGTTGATAQKAALVSMIDRLKDLNINVIYFQVRCSSDAFYQSTISPWSSYLTGTQGVDPGFDPLQTAIEEAHKRGIELHAWMNPYRIGTTTQYYAPGHPALLHPDWYVTFEGSRYWNPGMPEVRNHIKNVVKEVVDNYDIDGIHFDDYFYPSGAKSTSDPYKFNDKAQYDQYNAGMTLDKWREFNIDELVKGVSQSIKASKDDVIFGISPSGRIENALALYANPLTWLQNGWIDYLAPQIYWEIGHSTADFDRLARYWNTNSFSKPIFPGVAAYKFGDSQYPAYASMTQFYNQVELCRSLPNIKGVCWYRSQNILGSSFASYLLSTIYPSLSLVPEMGTKQYTVPGTPAITNVSNTINWSAAGNATAYAVYELKRRGTSGTWDAVARQIGTQLTFNGSAQKNYIVIAVNGRKTSALSNVLYIQ